MNRPPRLSLAQLPTPLVRLERLGRELGGANLWVKRDDLTGLEVSGNKVRKLEFVAADALATGCDTLVTEGTSQSNHCRATAAVCARLGLKCVLLLRPLPPAGPPVGNHLLDVLFGAECRAWPRPEYKAGRDKILADTLAELRAAGRTPRFTPAGASEPLGCWGYIEMLGELKPQLAAAGIGACDLVVGVSSDATFAGAVLGAKLYGLSDVRVWGVPVSDDVAYHTAETLRLCAAASATYQLGVDVSAADLHLLAGHIGQGYAIPTPEGLAALRLLARTEALVLDPVYTAKTFAAVLAGVREKRLGFERPVIFVHTGGVFSDFAWPEVLAG